jgi:hypothetical protein
MRPTSIYSSKIVVDEEEAGPNFKKKWQKHIGVFRHLFDLLFCSFLLFWKYICLISSRILNAYVYVIQVAYQKFTHTHMFLLEKNPMNWTINMLRDASKWSLFQFGDEPHQLPTPWILWTMVYYDVYYTAERTLIDGRTILKIILGHVGVKHANDPSCCGIIRIYRLLVP